MNALRRLTGAALPKLVAGNGSAQIIQLLALLVIARLYVPAEVGAFGLTVALAASVFPWAALRLEAAVPLSESEDQSRSTVASAFTALVIISVASTVVVDVSRRTGTLGPSATEHTGAAVGLLVFSASSIAVLNQIAVRHERYGLLSLRPLLQQSVTAVVQIGMGLMWAAWPALAGGQVIGRAAAASMMWKHAKNYFVWPTIARLRSTWREFRQFPTIFAPSTVLNAIGQQLPMLIAASLISPTALGGLSVAWQLSLAPVALLATAVSDNFSGVLARRKREARSGATRTYLRVSAAMLAVALVVVAVMVLVAPPLLILILGQDWQTTATYIRILAVVTGTCLVANSVSTVFTIHSGGRQFFMSNIVRIIFVGIATALLVTGSPPDQTVVTLLFTALAAGYVSAWILGLMVACRADQDLTPRA